MPDDVAQFIAVTNSDVATANHFLSAANGDLELALNLYADDDRSKLSEQSRKSPSMMMMNKKPEETSRPPIPPSRTKLINDEYTYPSIDNNDISSPFSGRGSTDTVDEFTNRLANLYKSPTEIMFAGGFESAKKTAKEEKKLLLISFHDPKEFSCQVLNRDVWNNNNIQEFIKESFIFLQVSPNDADYDKLKHYYPFDSLPCTFIIDSRTGKSIKSWKTIPNIDEFLQDTIKIMEK